MDASPNGIVLGTTEPTLSYAIDRIPCDGSGHVSGQPCGRDVILYGPPEGYVGDTWPEHREPTAYETSSDGL